MEKAVFFDLDGTLLDTAPDISNTLNEILQEFGYPALTVDEVRQKVGNGAKKLVERALPKGAENVDEVFLRFRERYARSDNEHTARFEGMDGLLSSLKARGVKLAVVTNKPQAATERVIQKFFGGLFDFVGGDSGLFPCKPDPTLTRYAALSLRVAPADCVFVGDGETDILTARNAGMRSVAVLWGYRSREELLAAGAKNFAVDVPELGKILEKNL